MQVFTSYTEWHQVAECLGWLHCHDNLVVCDDSETDECIGEWNSETNTGWLLKG